MLPRDVKTRWNSTYDMLATAVEYKVAVKAMCSDAELSLRKYELSKQEWVIVDQLVDVLKV